jgi:hypothetical protein
MRQSPADAEVSSPVGNDRKSAGFVVEPLAGTRYTLYSSFLNPREPDATTPVWVNGVVATASRFSSHRSSGPARQSAAEPGASESAVPITTERRSPPILLAKTLVDDLTAGVSIPRNWVVDATHWSSVSFVAVTQQFNTSPSLGRLTLNIPLSFAQFEREPIRASGRATNIGGAAQGEMGERVSGAGLSRRVSFTRRSLRGAGAPSPSRPSNTPI